MFQSLSRDSVYSNAPTYRNSRPLWRFNPSVGIAFIQTKTDFGSELLGLSVSIPQSG